MGLAGARTAGWDSPFDYASQALLYVPERMPGPNSPGYTQAVVRAVLPVVAASRGRAFLLFTSLRAMREAHALLKDGFAREGYDFPLLLQGEDSRSLLLERFRRLGNAVLVASQSFWEGRGRARRGAVAGDDRPAAVRAAGRSGARGAHRAHQRRGTQRLHGVPVARGRDHAQAGRRAPDPRRDRPRRADDLRHAAGGPPLRPAHLAEPAADAAHAGARGRGGVLCGGAGG